MKNFNVQEKNSRNANLLNYWVSAQDEREAMDLAIANARKRNADLDEVGGSVNDMASSVVVGETERWVHG